jgi:hypothetical protein
MPIFLGNQQIGLASLGSLPVSNIQQVLQTPVQLPSAGLQFWLDPTTYTTSGSKWLSKVGNATGSFTGSYIHSGSTFFNMNTASICEFNTTSSLDYSSQPNTLFVVGRSSGSATDHHGRLISAKGNNWLMGTYGGGSIAGLTEYQRAYYDGLFVIQDTAYDTQWRVYTAVWQNSSSASFFVNGVKVAQSTAGGQYGFDRPSINNGQFQSGNNFAQENTQADYGDIILYNRVLTSAEITQVYNTIKDKYGL